MRLPPLDPNLAFAILIAGLLVSYAEFLRPGSVFFGLAGAVAAVLAVAALVESGLRASAVLAALGCLILGAAAIWLRLPVWTWLVPAAGLVTACRYLTLGEGLRWTVVAPLATLWLTVTLALLRIAWIARQNKSAY